MNYFGFLDNSAAAFIIGSGGSIVSIFLNNRRRTDITSCVAVRMDNIGATGHKLWLTITWLVNDDSAWRIDKAWLTIRWLWWAGLVHNNRGWSHKSRLSVTWFWWTVVVWCDKGRLTVAWFGWSRIIGSGKCWLAIARLRWTTVVWGGKLRLTVGRFWWIVWISVTWQEITLAISF